MFDNRSEYYKWMTQTDKPNRYVKYRILLTELLLKQRDKYKTKNITILPTQFVIKPVRCY